MNAAAPTPVQRIAWGIARVFLRTVGRTSDGLRLCFDEGLTSGMMLEYVYRNQPSGRWGIGRAIDRAFLEAPGWQAVRERRANLERLLEEAITRLRAERRPAVVLDVASGPAAYVLAVLERVGPDGVSALCRDLDARWLDAGAAEAKRRRIPNVRFERGDALDEASLRAVAPRPTVAVSSGFYDWVTDDAVVRRSIVLLHETLEPGGWFVTTNQAGHPNLGFTTAVFNDFHRRPLDMKMRPASTIEGWMREAGFTIERTLADAHGYYSVTLARKRPA